MHVAVVAETAVPLGYLLEILVWRIFGPVGANNHTDP